MKIAFEDKVRVLDLEHVKLKHAITIQGFTGLPVFAWQERLAGVGEATADAFKADPAAAVKRMPMFTDAGWILGMAAAHWLMTAQAGEDPPPLDDDYDCDVLGFAVAFFNSMTEEVKARVPDQPGPKASPGRRAPSSRRTGTPKAPKAISAPPSSPTGS